MKPFIKYTCLLAFFIFFKTLSAQPNPCICNIDLFKTSDCCGELEISFSPFCAINGFIFDQITVNSNSVSPVTAEIESVLLNDPLHSFSLNAAGDLATITTPGNFLNTANSNGGSTVIGTVCYKNVNQVGNPFSVVVSDLLLSSGAISCNGIAEFPVTCPPAEPWEKLYGSMNDERPTRIKTFGDGVYVLGVRNINGSQLGTVSKFDLVTGNLIWDSELGPNVSVIPNDLEYVDGTSPEIIVVGNTLGVSDNETIYLKINATTGILTQQRAYNFAGREFSERILKHDNPQNPNFPYYILGRKNPTGQAPSSFDNPFVVNLDANLNINWIEEYTEVSGTEIEGYRGMVALYTGNLMLLGNGSIANEGVLMEIDGTNGGLQNALYYPDGIDFYDGIELSDGRVALTGTRFSTNEAIVLIVNDFTGSYAAYTGLIFPDETVFRDIKQDNNGDLYVTGKQKNSSPNQNVIHKLSYNGTVLQEVWSRTLFDGEAAFENPRLDVNTTFDAIFYTDARRDNPFGFGDFDLLVGSFDLELTDNCADSLPTTAQAYSVSTQVFSMNENPVFPPMFNEILDPIPLPFVCSNFCDPPPVCDFTFTTLCLTANFSASISNGTPPYFIEWDFDGDLIFDATGQNPAWTYLGPGTWQVTMRVTDATGAVICEITKPVIVQDNNAPILTCPNDITISTDAGLCTADYSFLVTVTDDCDMTPDINCVANGATIIANIPANSTNTYNKGVTTIDCIATDDAGNQSNCTFDITVVDNELPVLTCPANINTSADACDGGRTVLLTDPILSDNCPMATFTCDAQSGDFFSCGTTLVTCTATDMAGNTSTCSYNVNVECPCLEFTNTSLTCSANDDEYDFSISVLNLIGANPSNCTISVSTSQAGVVILNQVFSPGIPLTVTGTLQLATPPIPTNIVLNVTLDCVCPSGDPYSCTVSANLPVPCCKEVGVDNQQVCENAPTVVVPLVGCNNLFDVQQVRWYVADAPCPPQGSYGIPFQVTNSCTPLNLDPRYHNSDICVYAEVDMGSAAGPCTTLTSNTAIITLCEPVSCSVNSQEFCYMGAPITPNLLTATLSPATPNCGIFSTTWFDGNNVQVGTGLTYQPPALSLPIGSQVCAEFFTYRCEIVSECGTSDCISTITLHNDDAPLGNLHLNPSEPQPFCPGEDAALTYDKACAGSPAEWDWFRSNDGFVADITPLPSNGTMNDTYLTNRLYQDTWIRVEKQNGTCPVDQIDLFIDVTETLTLTNFSAKFDDDCNPTQVDLSLNILSPDYSLSSTCDFTIDWYHNGQIIGTTIQNTTPVTFTYTGNPLFGNFYAIVTDNCCPGQRRKTVVITLDPPMVAVVAGPCFRCLCEEVTLEAIVENEFAGCSYQWFKNGQIMPGETSKILTVDPGPVVTSFPAKTYTFEINCPNGCMETADYLLRQCGDCTEVAVSEEHAIEANLFPNPVSDRFQIDFAQPLSVNSYVEISSLNGQLLRKEMIQKGTSTFEQKTADWSSGVYFIMVYQEGIPVFLEQVVKQ